jgi:hypothetical protein
VRLSAAGQRAGGKQCRRQRENGAPSAEKPHLNTPVSADAADMSIRSVRIVGTISHAASDPALAFAHRSI